MNKISPKLKKQKSQTKKEILDLSLETNICILDTSAIVENPDVAEYCKIYKKHKPIVFVLIPAVLNELDGLKLKKKKILESIIDFEKLLLKCAKGGKLSIAKHVNQKDKIMFLKLELHDSVSKDYAWLKDFYTDKRIICVGKQLKAMGYKNISIVSRDILLQILCREENIKFIYQPDKKKKDVVQESDWSKKEIQNENSSTYIPPKD